MEIRNVTQFANFISAGNLQGLDMNLQQIIYCVNDYAAACNCHRGENKRKKYDECTRIYAEAVKNILPKFKNDFLSKTSERQISFFLDNGNIIGIICR